VIEIARDLQHVARPAGAPAIRFVLFDGEEEPFPTNDFYRDALRGSKAYATAHASATRAMVLLDYMGNTGATFPREGSSAPSLWSTVRASARRVGVGALFPQTTETTIYDDITPFERAGVPAVDVIDWDYKYRDGLQDTYDKLSEATIDAVGETMVDLLSRWR
jgi:glutaminyl-peptide cyclotransferase